MYRSSAWSFSGGYFSGDVGNNHRNYDFYGVRCVGR
jgi:hypothetical protein